MFLNLLVVWLLQNFVIVGIDFFIFLGYWIAVLRFGGNYYLYWLRGGHLKDKNIFIILSIGFVKLVDERKGEDLVDCFPLME